MFYFFPRRFIYGIYDCLLIRGCGRTDFQQGSSAKMFESVHEKIFTLPKQCLLYPGHDYKGATVKTVHEEKEFNPRLGKDVNVNDFAVYINNLGLAHSNKIDIAVPANLKCVRAFMRCSHVGWRSNLADVQIVDVREPDEYVGVLGHIQGSILVPLGELIEKTKDLDNSIPIITVCRSGARSAQAAMKLDKAGFKRIANLAGGMLRWNAERLPIFAD